ncbi:MAG TPA: hypothetical protein VGS80_24260 [Ktedonobacterales bacterium]|nr:hypothetical protein [Ktedonobacterales bacterium]
MAVKELSWEAWRAVPEAAWDTMPRDEWEAWSQFVLRWECADRMRDELYCALVSFGIQLESVDTASTRELRGVVERDGVRVEVRIEVPETLAGQEAQPMA